MVAFLSSRDHRISMTIARNFSMLSAEQNDLITRTAPGTAAGALLRRYWQPAALVDELSGNRPVKPVRDRTWVAAKWCPRTS